jgi:hypothetical protein
MPWYYNLDVFCDILSQLHMLEGEPQHIDAEMLAPEGCLPVGICFFYHQSWKSYGSRFDKWLSQAQPQQDLSKLSKLLTKLYDLRYK